MQISTYSLSPGTSCDLPGMAHGAYEHGGMIHVVYSPGPSTQVSVAMVYTSQVVDGSRLVGIVNVPNYGPCCVWSVDRP